MNDAGTYLRLYFNINNCFSFSTNSISALMRKPVQQGQPILNFYIESKIIFVKNDFMINLFPFYKNFKFH